MALRHLWMALLLRRNFLLKGLLIPGQVLALICPKKLLICYVSATAGDRIITWKPVSQERLDIKTLKAEHPALYKKYANKTSFRRFSIKAEA